MFRKVYLENFLVFDSIEFDLEKKKGEPLKKAFIYGENGSGKTSLIKGIRAIQSILTSMNSLGPYSEIMEKLEKFDEYIVRYLDGSKIINNSLPKEPSISRFSKKHRMIGSSGDMKLEYDFLLSDKAYKYSISISENHEVVYEELKYMIGERIAKAYQYDANSDGEINISSKFIKSAKYRKELSLKHSKHKNNHAFTAMLYYDYKHIDDEFFSNNVDTGICKLFDKLVVEDVVINYFEGEIALDKEKKIDNYVKVCNEVIPMLNSDIDSLYYEKIYINEKIKYKLYLKKYIAGALRHIYFKDESTGTLSILSIIGSLIESYKNDDMFVHIADEMDDGIHDLTFTKLSNALVNLDNVQIIATTHNTALLEHLDTEYIFILRTNSNGSKEIVNLKNYKIQKNNNKRKMYLDGLFEGIPIDEDFDLDSILKGISV